jgi:hypothetical protein
MDRNLLLDQQCASNVIVRDILGRIVAMAEQLVLLILSKSVAVVFQDYMGMRHIVMCGLRCCTV